MLSLSAQKLNEIKRAENIQNMRLIKFDDFAATDRLRSDYVYLTKNIKREEKKELFETENE